VELAVKSITGTTVILKSSDPSINVPGTVTIAAGAFVADFTIKAAAIKYGGLPTTGTIKAIFPDGHTVSLTVTDDPLPLPPDE
jgi:hypothetical protein